MSPALLTAKSDSSSRLITDMRLLGASLKCDKFQTPTIAEILRKIGNLWEPGKKLFFCRLDMKDAFFQIGIREDSQNLLGFSVGSGQNYKYTRLPQGLHINDLARSTQP